LTCINIYKAGLFFFFIDYNFHQKRKMICLDRKRFSLIAIALVCCFYLTAQDYFVKQFSYSGGFRFYSTELSPDSGLVICGSTGYAEGSLIKFNKHGMIDWSVACGTDSSGGSFFYGSTQLHNRIYAAGQTGGNPYLFKCDFNGQKIFSKTYTTNSVNSWDNVIAITNDSLNLYMLCNIHFQSILIKADTLGNVIWSKKFPMSSADDILFDPALNRIVISTFMSVNSTASYLTSIDTSGNIQWQKFYPSFLIDRITDTKNGSGYLLGGRNSLTNGFYSFISKTNISGDIIWAKSFAADSAVNSLPSVFSLYSANNGSIYFGNSTNAFATIIAPPTIIKMDSSGNVMWGKYFSSPIYPDASVGSFVEPVSGHFYIVAAYNQNGVFISTDTSANPNCDFLAFLPHDTTFSFQDSATFLSGQSSSIITLNAADTVYSISLPQFFDCANSIQSVSNTMAEVVVFPNPAQTSTTFKMENLDGNKTLIIYDQLGKEIWRKETAENEIGFSTDGFAAGLYFYRMEREGEIIASGKLVIE
jgi:hypothetical protein